MCRDRTNFVSFKVEFDSTSSKRVKAFYKNMLRKCSENVDF